MLKEGSLLYFDPFVFKNGAPPKPKYFVVLATMDDDKMLLASLPTSKDHVPTDAVVVRGCVNIPERCVNAFVFEEGDQITEGFCIPRRTFIYGEQLDIYTKHYINSMPSTMAELGTLLPELFAALKNCLRQATNISKKYLRWL